MKIISAHADLLIEKGDIDGALILLNPISESATPEVKSKAAEIYLLHKKDKKMYARCYKSLVDTDPDNVRNYVTLGE